MPRSAAPKKRVEPVTYTTLHPVLPGEQAPSYGQSFADATAWLESRAARYLRHLQLGTWPMPLPLSVERLSLGSCVLTEDVLAAPRLRHLSVDELVDSVPLVHDGIEELVLPGDLGALGALDGARLPSLKKLRVHSMVADVAHLERLAGLVAALRAQHVELAFLASWHGREAQVQIGPDVARALAPIADRIVGLGLAGDRSGRETSFTWDVPLPRLQHLEFSGTPSPASLRERGFEAATELSFGPAMDGDDAGRCIDNIVAAGIGPRLRTLRFAGTRPVERPLARLSMGAFEALEELAFVVFRRDVSSAFSIGMGFLDARADAFPKLTRWALLGTELEAFAASPYAARTKELRVQHVPRLDAAWLHERVPALDRIVVSSFNVRSYWTASDSMGRDGTARTPIDAGLGPAIEVVAESRSTPQVAEPIDGTANRRRTFDPLLAALFAFGRALVHAPDEARAGSDWMPPLLARACPKMYRAIRMPIDLEPLEALGRLELDAAAPDWIERYRGPIARAFGDVGATVFTLGAHAESAQTALLRGASPEGAGRFLETWEALPTALRAELDTVRGWCRAMTRFTPPAPDGAARGARAAAGLPRCLHSLDALTHSALRLPFRSAEGFPALFPFETVTRDHIVRRTLQHWVGLLVTRGPGESRFRGGPLSGRYEWTGDGRTFVVAWNKAGAAGAGRETRGACAEFVVRDRLQSMPSSIEGLVDAVHAAMGGTGTCGFFVARNGRYRLPHDPTAAGNPMLEALIRPGPFTASPDGDSSEEQDALTAKLVDRVIAGGGAIHPEELALIGAPGGVERPKKELAKVVAALGKLGLVAP